MNTYRKQLQAELDALITRRVGLRRGLDKIAHGWRIGDSHNTSMAIDEMRRQLKATEFDYARLCTALGQESRLAAPVKLDAASIARGRQILAARSKVTSPRIVNRGRTVSGYMTKVMLPER